ncbi:MAG: DUF1269 domain-containing protein [Pseudolabrys sp.]|nr:DUF1269 domain-containing protein [Pseudolabrys sp.]
MNQMLVAVFDTEMAAFEALSTLRELHKQGSISLYASAVVVKDKAGRVRVKQEAEYGPAGTALGLLTGSILGILGGPAGLAAGASLGGITGFLFDLDKIVVGATLLDDTSKTLTAGKAAVLAEVQESWTSLVDERLRKQGGTVFRQFRVDVVEDQLVREGIALEASLRGLRDELSHAMAQDRAAIQRDIDQTKARLKATQDQAIARLDQARAEMDARVTALRDQAKAASERARERIAKRIADAKTDFGLRSKKLNQAWALTKEALAA